MPTFTSTPTPPSFPRGNIQVPRFDGIVDAGVSHELPATASSSAKALSARVASLFPGWGAKQPSTIRMRRQVAPTEWHPPHTDSWDSWYAEGNGVLVSAMWVAFVS